MTTETKPQENNPAILISVLTCVALFLISAFLLSGATFSIFKILWLFPVLAYMLNIALLVALLGKPFRGLVVFRIVGVIIPPIGILAALIPN